MNRFALHWLALVRAGRFTHVMLLDKDRPAPSADGAAAVKTIRAHAGEYGTKPDKIVMVGFSAGAVVTVAIVLQSDVSARPNYAAPIYGSTFGSMRELPKGLPPFFLAVAQDDNGAGFLTDRLYAALLAAGYRPEVHRFQSGGHGFGMTRRMTTSDHWIDEFFWWMESNGLTRKPGDPDRQGRGRRRRSRLTEGQDEKPRRRRRVVPDRGGPGHRCRRSR